MQLSSQAGTLAHRRLGSLGTWGLVDVDYRSCFCFWYSTGAGAGAKGDCACASLILQSLSLLVSPDDFDSQTKSLLNLFLAALSQRS